MHKIYIKKILNIGTLWNSVTLKYYATIIALQISIAYTSIIQQTNIDCIT